MAIEMTAPIIAVLAFGLLTVAAIVYASMKADEARNLREQAIAAAANAEQLRERAEVAEQRVCETNVRVGKHLSESVVLLAHCDALEAENAYMRACLVHRKQVLAGSMLQAEIIRPERKLAILDGIAP